MSLLKKKKKVSFWKGHDLWLRKTILFKKSMEVCINLNLCLTANKIDKGDPVFIRKKIKLAILPLISVLFHDKVQSVWFTSWLVVYESIQSNYLQLRHRTQTFLTDTPASFWYQICFGKLIPYGAKVIYHNTYSLFGHQPVLHEVPL